MTEETPRPRILLVDDDKALLELLDARLKALGRFEVTAVSRAREVLSRLTEIKPHLIISDIDMPGMDGGSLAAELRELEAGRHIPILFLSSMISLAESEAGAGLVGGWPMLSKKTPFEKLVTAIEQTLKNPPSSNPAA